MILSKILTSSLFIFHSVSLFYVLISGKKPAFTVLCMLCKNFTELSIMGILIDMCIVHVTGGSAGPRCVPYCCL